MYKTINEMHQERTRAWEEAKSFLDSHRTENGTLSAEDAAVYDAMEANVVALGKEIERMERCAALDAELSRPVAAPLTNSPAAGLASAPVRSPRASAEYKTAMLAALRTNFRQVSDILQEGVDSSGGYLVPVEYDARLIDILNEENIMRSLGTTITTSGEHRINLAAAKPAAAWIEEGEALTFGDAAFAQTILDAHKLHVAIKVTEELMYDSAFNLETYIIDQFGKALANAEEDAFLNGDGSGKPLGLFASAGGGNVVNTVTSLSTDDIIDLIYALRRPYRKNAKFIMNDKTLAYLRALKDGNGQYLWQPSYQAGEPDRLLGYPVYTSAYAPVDAIAFGDYSYYNIGDRGTRSFQELRELFAGNGMLAFIAKERVDGKLVLPEAVQILKFNAANG